MAHVWRGIYADALLRPQEKLQAGDEDGARQYLTEKVNYEVRMSGSQ
jgi:hypothetical protein